MLFSKVLAVVFLFIVKLRWPINLSFFAVLKQRYGHIVLLKVRELEKVCKKHEKIKLDIIYLEDCLANNVIPKFLFFKLSNNRLRNS